MIVKIVSDHTSSIVMKPGKKSFYFPSSLISTKFSAILSFGFYSIFAVWTNQFDTLIRQSLAQGITIISAVCYQSCRAFIYQTHVQGFLHQGHFVSLSSGGPYGDRKTSSVCDCHDLAALTPLSFADMIPPFLALENVPSIKHSLISISPISLRC